MGSAVLAMDQYEVVDKLGFRYQITKLGASDFATIIAGAQKRSNWVRCVDPQSTVASECSRKSSFVVLQQDRAEVIRATSLPGKCLTQAGVSQRPQLQ